MKEIQAILVEDQELGMQNLKFKITQNCPSVEIVAKCSSGQEAIKAIQEHEPQLVFLDYDLGSMTGFQVLDRLDYLDFEVIFVTNHNQYAIDAINSYDSTYFLVKPIDDQNLVEGVKKAQRILESKFKAKEFLTVRSIGQIDRIPIRQITYLEASDVSTVIHLDSGRVFVYSKPLKHVSNLLSSYNFCRIHRSYTVNLQVVYTIIKEDGMYYCIVPHPQSKKGKKLPVENKYRASMLKHI